ncbi:hypothetical protein IW150_001149 [Coemansia sp. RSA 2607]|nr:hypothetical protein IW150_001149 [Coemansia sp. RSA 2607]
MPTEEEQKARVAEWEEKLKGKYLVDDVTADEKPADEKPADEKPAEEKPVDAKPANDASPSDPAPEQQTKTTEKPQETVLLSSLPQPLRVIKPGSRITRDLRPNRMNVVCDKDGLILKVQFY